MVEKFQNSIKKMIFQEDRILLAVSGGMDSVLMCHLCHKIGLDFGIAHCNFRLRGDDSDGDESFVRDLAKDLDVPFYVKHFDTKSIKEKQGGSIQMVARNLRYGWFEEIRLNNDFKYIATAHHLNDSLETVVYNFIKGTGIRGLTGINEKNGNVIRPLSVFSRKEIESMIAEWDIKFRTDISNSDTKYSRNKIRHEIIPLMKEMNPSLEKTFIETAENLKETESILHFFINKLRGEIISEKDGLILLDKNKLKDYPNTKTILYELLKPYGFDKKHVTHSLMQMMSGISGSKILSLTHKLTNDREYLIIEKVQTFISDDEIIIPNEIGVVDLGGEGKWMYYTSTVGSIKILNHDYKKMYCFDLDKIIFPCKARKRESGDYFYPLGMKGKKKLKKYFTDNKYSIPQKEKTWILDSNEKIVAILNGQIDDRFKITEKTKLVWVWAKIA